MRIQPIAPVIPLRNDASTNSDKRIVQKKHNESVVVELDTYKSKTGAARVTMKRVLEHLEWFKTL